jgi:hypothetical protein
LVALGILVIGSPFNKGPNRWATKITPDEFLNLVTPDAQKINFYEREFKTNSDSEYQLKG